MAIEIENPLHALPLAKLYEMLGDAWLAQLRVEIGSSYHLPSSTAIGLREFKELAPMLQQALEHPHTDDAGGIANAVHNYAKWPMPSPIIVALAMKTGIGRPKVFLTGTED